MLTVGIDTYLTVDEATRYLREHYAAGDERLMAWEYLTETEKEIYLRKACEEISRVKYRGVTFTAFQKLPFPRYFGRGFSMPYRNLFAPDAYLFPEMREIPAEVKFAQAEEAFEICSPSADSENAEMLTGAVKSYSIGHLSETFGTAKAGSIEAEIKSRIAQGYLRQYTEGSYELC